jgi:hypothetical protein
MCVCVYMLEVAGEHQPGLLRLSACGDPLTAEWAQRHQALLAVCQLSCAAAHIHSWVPLDAKESAFRPCCSPLALPAGSCRALVAYMHTVVVESQRPLALLLAWLSHW